MALITPGDAARFPRPFTAAPKAFVFAPPIRRETDSDVKEGGKAATENEKQGGGNEVRIKSRHNVGYDQ